MRHYFSNMKGWLFPLSFIIIFVATSFTPELRSTWKKDNFYNAEKLLPPGDWTLVAQKDGIDVSYKLEQCSEGQRILFLIRNNTIASQNVEFECKVTSTGRDLVFPSLINAVEGNGTLEGSCADLAYQSTFIALPNAVTVDAIVLTIK